MRTMIIVMAIATVTTFTGCNIDALTDNETFNSNSGNTTQTDTTTTTTTTTNNTDSNNIGQTDETAVLGGIAGTEEAFLDAGLDPDTGEPIPTGL